MSTRAFRRPALLGLSCLFVVLAHAEQPAPSSRESVSLERFPVSAVAMARPGMDRQNPEDDVLSEGLPYTHRFRAGSPLLEGISANLDRAGISLPANSERQPRAVTETIARGVVRATRQEAKNFVLEALEIHHIGRSEKNDPSSDASGAFRFRFGVSHLAPKVDLRYRVGQSALNVSVGARGQVGIDLDTGRLAGTLIHVGYDRPTKTFGLSFRLGF